MTESTSPPHLYWLFGLPFDALSLEELRSCIFRAADGGNQIVFATANVNFLAEASRNPRFREDVLSADLNVADGMPVLWLGRLLGARFKGRVAGSDLLHSLIHSPGDRPLRAFFFGGDEGAAAAALDAVNRAGGGLVGVGSYYPGFADIDVMSDAAVIEEINRCNPDFLIVALGAVKGHRWIEANRHRLNARVISHLGAAINFVSGRLRRAPIVYQRLGLEWAWRIREEPKLLRRYMRDGWYLLRVVTELFWKEALAKAFGRLGASATVVVTGSPHSNYRVIVNGKLCDEQAQLLRQRLALHLPSGATELAIELKNVRQLDASGTGWLFEMRYRPCAGWARASILSDSTSRASLSRRQADFLLTEERGD